MKLKVGKIGLLCRLVAVSSVMLFSQHAMAVGTPAGQVISNTATVDYNVNGFDQTDLVSAVSFVVDRRVDFTLTQLGVALVDVTPGQPTPGFFDFELSNDSNSPLDFRVLLAQMVGGDPRPGFPDTGTMGAVDFAVSTDTVSGTDPDPIRGGLQFVDDLPADDSIRIRVFGDAALAMLDGQVAGVQLDAIAAQPGAAGLGADLVEAANTDTGIENVFADNPLPGPGPGGDGVEVITDGFLVVSAALTVVKSYEVIAGDLGSGLPIPGSTVEYKIEVTNASATTAADAVIITDVMDGPLTLSLDRDVYSATGDISVDNGPAAPFFCDVDDGPDTDGCTLAGVTVTVGATGVLDISVAGSTTLTILYQVTIPDPATTPPIIP